MSRITLFEPILGQGLRYVNFFNGRLLSGEDLTRERQAGRDVDHRLGQAIGEGIAYGLEVAETVGVSTAAAPVLTVERGLALNRVGQTLMLPARADIALIRPPETAPAPDALFRECEPVHSAGIPTSGDGVYLLVFGPASGKEGRAPVSGLGTGVADCNSKYLVEGVAFSLIKLNVANLLDDPPRLRNRLAHACFGTIDPRMTDFALDPFGPPPARYGFIDDLRPSFVTDCDVPLAILYWTATGGIQFVDRWSVRRRLTRAAATAWPLLVGDRRVSEAEAMFHQFQEQLEDIRLSTPNLAQVFVEDRFDFLPPAGLLPIVGAGAQAGFDLAAFFGPRGSNDVALTDARLLRDLLHESLYHEPIDLRTPERVQLYLVRENLVAVEAGQKTQLALVFASGALPYRGVARFDKLQPDAPGKARWALSRFAPTVI